MGPKSHVYRAAVKKELCFEARTPSPSPPPSPSPSPSPSCRHRRRLVYLALVRAVAVASSLSRARGRSARTSLGSALAMETAAPRDRDCLWRDAARRLSAIAAPRRGRAARPLLSPHKRSRRQPFPFDWYSNSPPGGVCARGATSRLASRSLSPSGARALFIASGRRRSQREYASR